MNNTTTPTEVISTGCPALNVALQIKGLPLGRIVEVLGPDGAANRTFGLRVAAEAQRAGHLAMWVDCTHTLDLAEARERGIQLDEILISQPDVAGQALEMIETLARTCTVRLIIVDGLAKFADDEGPRADPNSASIRATASALRKISAVADACGVLILFLTERGTKLVGSTLISNSLKYYSSVRLQLSPSLTTAKILKNKFAPGIFGTIEIVRARPTPPSPDGQPLKAGLRGLFSSPGKDPAP